MVLHLAIFEVMAMLARRIKPSKDKWNWMLIITSVILFMFSAMFANTDLIGASEGIRVGFMKMALGTGFMAAAFLVAVWFGFHGLLSGLISKDWNILSGLVISLFLYIPTFLLFFLFSMTMIYLFQIRSAVITFCIFCSIPCVLFFCGLKRKPRMEIAKKALEAIGTSAPSLNAHIGAAKE